MRLALESRVFLVLTRGIAKQLPIEHIVGCNEPALMAKILDSNLTPFQTPFQTRKADPFSDTAG